MKLFWLFFLFFFPPTFEKVDKDCENLVRNTISNMKANIDKYGDDKYSNRQKANMRRRAKKIRQSMKLWWKWCQKGTKEKLPSDPRVPLFNTDDVDVDFEMTTEPQPETTTTTHWEYLFDDDAFDSQFDSFPGSFDDDDENKKSSTGHFSGTTTESSTLAVLTHMMTESSTSHPSATMTTHWEYNFDEEDFDSEFETFPENAEEKEKVLTLQAGGQINVSNVDLGQNGKLILRSHDGKKTSKAISLILAVVECPEVNLRSLWGTTNFFLLHSQGSNC